MRDAERRFGTALCALGRMLDEAGQPRYSGARGDSLLVRYHPSDHEALVACWSMCPALPPSDVKVYEMNVAMMPDLRVTPGHVHIHVEVRSHARP